jgi:hypothetical protein
MGKKRTRAVLESEEEQAVAQADDFEKELEAAREIFLEERRTQQEEAEAQQEGQRMAPIHNRVSGRIHRSYRPRFRSMPSGTKTPDLSDR